MIIIYQIHPLVTNLFFLISVPTWQVNEIAAVRTGNSKSLKLAGSSSSSSSENNEVFITYVI